MRPMQTNVTIDPIPLEPSPRRRCAGRDCTRSSPRPAASRSGCAIKLNQNEEYWRLKSLMRGEALHTVCEEAFCPNLGECWGRGIATFLLMGDICTRSCKFCNVQSGKPLPLDEDEPRRVAESVAQDGPAPRRAHQRGPR